MVNKDKIVILFVCSNDRAGKGTFTNTVWDYDSDSDSGRALGGSPLSLQCVTHRLMVHSCIWNCCQQRAGLAGQRDWWATSARCNRRMSCPNVFARPTRTPPKPQPKPQRLPISGRQFLGLGLGLSYGNHDVTHLLLSGPLKVLGEISVKSETEHPNSQPQPKTKWAWWEKCRRSDW